MLKTLNSFFFVFQNKSECVPIRHFGRKGEFGDAINVMLVAAGFNFKRMMNIYKKNLADIFVQIQTRFCFFLYRPQYKLAF